MMDDDGDDDGDDDVLLSKHMASVCTLFGVKNQHDIQQKIFLEHVVAVWDVNMFNMEMIK